MPASVSTHKAREAPGGLPVRHTALYHAHRALGAAIEERHGWLVPVSYPSPSREMEALQHGVGLLDIGDSGKIDLKSGDLDAVLAALPGDQRVSVGSVVSVHAAMRLCRLTAGHALILTPPAARQESFDRFQEIASRFAHTHAIDMTGALCGLRLIGPNAPLVLERLTPVDLAADRFVGGMVAQAGLARIHAIMLRRDSGTSLGYDLYVDRDLGGYLWDTLLETGAPLGIAPVGHGAAAEAY